MRIVLLLCGGNARFLGSTAAASATLNPRSTISQRRYWNAAAIAGPISVAFVDIGHCDTQIGPFQGSNNSNSRVKVRVRLNMNGIITVESATTIEDTIDQQIPRRDVTHSNIEKMEIDFVDSFHSEVLKTFLSVLKKLYMHQKYGFAYLWRGEAQMKRCGRGARLPPGTFNVPRKARGTSCYHTPTFRSNETEKVVQHIEEENTNLEGHEGWILVGGGGVEEDVPQVLQYRKSSSYQISCYPHGITSLIYEK
uniref:Uncharacterized protein n=1 Tax=Cucumis melo TaxID=3656 RepID=A0A9I9ELP4_CUCME